MDLRTEVLAIVVGGAPAPGANAAISAIVLESINAGYNVIGIKNGFKMIKTGSSDGAIMHLRRADVTQLYRTGGVFLRSSKEELTLEELKNVLHVLDSLSVRYLVTLGSAVTAQSALRLWELAKEMEYPLSVVHVPKTIFNDLPLPPNSLYYGHATAVEVGTQLLNQLSTDAKSTERFFVAVSIGQRAGHLALSMGRASSAMLTVIPEEFPDGLAPEALLRTLEAAIIKRIMSDHSYGVIVLAEGLADKMARQARLEFFGTDDLDTAHQELGRNVVKELIKRLDVGAVARNLGNELRSADPIARDVEIARDLGFMAVSYLQRDMSGGMVTLSEEGASYMPLHTLVDESKHVKLRLVDTRGAPFVVAQHYMIRLTHTDLANPDFVAEFAKAWTRVARDKAAKTTEMVRERYGGVATRELQLEWRPPQLPAKH